MRRSYPSDISREQFEEIRPILEEATKKTHPRQYDLYDNSVLFYTSLKRAVLGAQYHMISRSGRMSAIIMIYGQNRILRTAKA